MNNANKQMLLDMAKKTISDKIKELENNIDGLNINSSLDSYQNSTVLLKEIEQNLNKLRTTLSESN